MAAPFHYHRRRAFVLQFLRYSRDGWRRIWLCPVCKRKEVTS
jgi:hypothetical protein